MILYRGSFCTIILLAVVLIIANDVRYWCVKVKLSEERTRFFYKHYNVVQKKKFYSTYLRKCFDFLILFIALLH